MVGFAENRLEEVSNMFLRNGGFNGDESHARKYEVNLNFLRIGDLSKCKHSEKCFIAFICCNLQFTPKKSSSENLVPIHLGKQVSCPQYSSWSPVLSHT